MMNEVLHANIFFLIASIATVVFCVLVSLILFQVLKIVRSLRSIIEKIEVGSEALARDVAEVRELVSSGGIFAKLFKFMMGSKRRRSRTKKSDYVED
jgi:C4-dicarboxylate transporter